jgi:hypothetical protein
MEHISQADHQGLTECAQACCLMPWMLTSGASYVPRTQQFVEQDQFFVLCFKQSAPLLLCCKP